MTLHTLDAGPDALRDSGSQGHRGVNSFHVFITDKNLQTVTGLTLPGVGSDPVIWDLVDTLGDGVGELACSDCCLDNVSG